MSTIPYDNASEERKTYHHSQRNKFTMTEDKLLKELVERYGTNSWGKIAEIIPNRNSRQCHDRWVNYLSPNINKNPWTEEEEMLLLSTIEQIGLHWVKIAKKLPGRTDIQIKNRWNVIKRRRAADLKTIMQYNAYFARPQIPEKPKKQETETDTENPLILKNYTPNPPKENQSNQKQQKSPHPQQQRTNAVELVNQANNQQNEILINIPFDSIFSTCNDFDLFDDREWF